MISLTGIHTPIATPFMTTGDLDLPALRRNVQRWMQTPLRGLVVLGSNGEAAHLDDTEAEAVAGTVREAMPGDRPLVVGTGRETTAATVAATRRAASIGADAALVRTPSFFKPQLTGDVLVAHYLRVADASAIPILLYNVTMFTGVNLQPEVVERLALHPNIVGMKESGSDLAAIADLVNRTPAGFAVLAGSATTFVHALCAGCDGGVLALASLVPAACVRLQTLVAECRLAEARALQARLLPLARLVGAGGGVTALKAAMNHLGYEGGVPRAPLPPATPELVRALARELDALRQRDPEAVGS